MAANQAGHLRLGWPKSKCQGSNKGRILRHSPTHFDRVARNVSQNGSNRCAQDVVLPTNAIAEVRPDDGRTTRKDFCGGRAAIRVGNLGLA